MLLFIYHLRKMSSIGVNALNKTLSLRLRVCAFKHREKSRQKKNRKALRITIN
jgi:hypothetical protein